MVETNSPRLDRTWLYGILLLAVSVLVFMIPSFFHIDEDYYPLFLGNYLIAIFYFGVICFNHRLSIHQQNGLAPLLVFAVLSLVSCYALNRNLQIVNNNIAWWPALLIVTSVNFISTPFHSHLPPFLRITSCFIAGIALIAFLYLAIHLLPFYLLSALAVLVFGLGLHTFVPLLFIVYTIAFIRRVGLADRHNFYAFGVGALVTLLAFLQFVDLKAIFTL